jgi:hypothetical protein
MRRLDRPPSPKEALEQLEALFQEGLGLRAFLQHLPPGATLAEAQLLREKLTQAQRTPCSFLDARYGIVRPE